MANKWLNLLIIVVVIGVAYYLLQGGGLPGAKKLSFSEASAQLASAVTDNDIDNSFILAGNVDQVMEQGKTKWEFLERKFSTVAGQSDAAGKDLAEVYLKLAALGKVYDAIQEKNVTLQKLGGKDVCSQISLRKERTELVKDYYSKLVELSKESQQFTVRYSEESKQLGFQPYKVNELEINSILQFKEQVTDQLGTLCAEENK